jgi:hypothetical protein
MKKYWTILIIWTIFLILIEVILWNLPRHLFTDLWSVIFWIFFAFNSFLIVDAFIFISYLILIFWERRIMNCLHCKNNSCYTKHLDYFYCFAKDKLISKKDIKPSKNCDFFIIQKEEE